MPSCVLRFCTNHYSKLNKNDGVTYHRFPSEELMRLKWISIVQAQRSEYDWMPTKSSTICSAHFKEEDKYTTPKGYMCIKKTAVPVVESFQEEVLQPASPNSLTGVDISDTDSMFDTPTVAVLKSRVHNLTLKKQVLQKKNKLLKSQNKRYKTKIVSLKIMLRILKKDNLTLKKQRMANIIETALEKNTSGN